MKDAFKRCSGIGFAAAIMLAGCGDSSSSDGAGGQDAGGHNAGGDDAGGAGGGCVVDTTYQPAIDPASFVAAVDNPLFPLVPGTTWTYAEGSGVVTTTVTEDTKIIMGVTCVVVHDTLTDGGQIVEDTFDWYAQDESGAVWYFGEDTKEYEQGVVSSTAGSWTGGVDGALPGILIPATPKVGDPEYRQEYYACEAEDVGQVVAVDEAVTVPFGSYTGCLKTHDTSKIEPTVSETKFYCPDVGLVLSVDDVTGEREELTALAP